VIALADNFLAGSLLSLLLPVGLLIALVTWYWIAVRRVPVHTDEAATTLPAADVVQAAGTAVHDVTPTEPPPEQG
jgi:hypothetical protein